MSVFLIMVTFKSFAPIKHSCLHFGQNKGKFSSTVSGRIFIRVLLQQTGHNTHSVFDTCFSPPAINYFCKFLSNSITWDLLLWQTESLLLLNSAIVQCVLFLQAGHGIKSVLTAEIIIYFFLICKITEMQLY